MSNEHTPGPYYVGQLDDGTLIISDDGSPDFLAEIPYDGVAGEARQRANADLFAAAPDLLIACQLRAMLDDWAGSEEEDGKLQADILRRCRELGWKVDPAEFNGMVDVIPFIDNLARVALAKAKGGG